MPRGCLHLVIDLCMHAPLLILHITIRTSRIGIVNYRPRASSARRFGCPLFITVCHIICLLLQLLPAHVVIIVFGLLLLDGHTAGGRMFLQILLELVRVFYLLEAVHIDVIL